MPSQRGRTLGDVGRWFEQDGARRKQMVTNSGEGDDDKLLDHLVLGGGEHDTRAIHVVAHYDDYHVDDRKAEAERDPERLQPGNHERVAESKVAQRVEQRE
eukprot:689008-Prymnesium_polylepis.2